MLNFKFLKLSSVFFALAFVFLFPRNISLAQVGLTEENISKIEIQDVKITPFADKLEISGALFNPNENIVSPEITRLLILETIDPLIKPKNEIEMLPSLTVAAEEGTEYFSLQPNERKDFSYILPMSPHIPKTNYNFYLGFMRANGQIEAYQIEAVKDFGSSQKEGFLAFDQESCVLIGKDGKEYGNNDGPVFPPGESPEARCLIKNIGNKEVEVSSKIIWKEVFVFGKPLEGKIAVEKPVQKIFFKPGETKTVTLRLPKAEKPQVYQSFWSFEDGEGRSRSFNMFFRWTIRGESGRIKNISQAGALKDSYGRGEKISLSVDYFGSADLFWAGAGQDVSKLDNLKMKAVIKDKDGNICGEKEEDLEDVTDAQIKNKLMEVNLDKKCEEPAYNVSLISGQNQLSEQSGSLPKIINNESLLIYLYSGFAIILVALATFFISRKSKLSASSLVIFFIGLTMVPSLILAVTSESYPNPSGGSTWSGKWMGDWGLIGGTNRLISNPSGGGGMNKLGIYDITVDFSNYYNNTGGNVDLYDVWMDYRSTDNSWP